MLMMGHTAGCSHKIDEVAGILTPILEAGTRNFIRHRIDGRVDLSEAATGDDHGRRHSQLPPQFSSRPLYAVLGDEIREVLSLLHFRYRHGASVSISAS